MTFASSEPFAIERPVKLPARDIVDAVVRNMRENLEELPYSKLAPSRYTVYLHPTEYARLEAIVPIMQEQTVRALSEELDRLGKRSHLKRLTDRVRRVAVAGLEKAGGEFHVTFLPDPDEELEEGGVLVYSELKLPARPEPGSGERTRRITTVHTSHGTTVREQKVTERTNQRVVARIEYTDDSGPHTHDVVTDSLVIGRGGIAYPVDIRIASSPDVSREHARIRRDPHTGVFFLIDLSSFGTTLNGRHVPAGYEKVDGVKRESGSETALPDVARIGLADTVFLEFRRVSGA
jgi:pSer/pThr/pTyr-binding forkhead associated (FHA) protein